MPRLLRFFLSISDPLVPDISPRESLMVVKIYGSPKSPNVQRVLIVLKEKEVQYELVKVNLFLFENNAPEYLKHQPFGQIPYMVCES